KPAIERRDRSVRIDFVDCVKTRGGRSGHVQASIRSQRQVIGRDARLERRVNVNLPITRNLEDCPAAVSDEKVKVLVEGYAGCNAHPFGVGGDGTVLGDAVNRSIIARRNIKVAVSIQRKAGRVHHLDDVRPYVETRVNLEDGNRNLLSTRTGERYEDI